MSAKTASYLEQTCEINNTICHYVEAGVGSPETLLIHGSLCDYRYWRWQLPAFGATSCTIAPSLRGYWPHTGPHPSQKFSVLQHALDMQALIEMLSPNRPLHVLGHSRGALVAMVLAELAPNHVRSLILADPGFHSSSLPPSHGFQIEAAEKFRQGDTEGALTLFIDSVSGENTWARTTGWFKTMVKENAATILSQELEADKEYDLNRVPKLKCPTLLLGGANSPPRYKHILDMLELLLPDVRRATIPLATHGMNLANPKAFNNNALAFWQSLTHPSATSPQNASAFPQA
ncbi:MAG: alpha/beta hydrolase [Pusillimonas sp.]|jgi:pimeloyl-ACP methyl ester carboxylesterase|nr:alpha/beta hydrolase [Pusillimonas sp.]